MRQSAGSHEADHDTLCLDEALRDRFGQDVGVIAGQSAPRCEMVIHLTCDESVVRKKTRLLR
jgi:hypothetical protein